MLRRSIHGIILGSISCIFVHSVLAGDAIAIGYNTDGAWTAVTYNRSSTPKGGPHYRAATEACTFALRDLRVRASDYLARTAIVGESDRTGYVAVAQGKATVPNKDVTAVGRGRRQVKRTRKRWRDSTRRALPRTNKSCMVIFRTALIQERIEQRVVMPGARMFQKHKARPARPPLRLNTNDGSAFCPRREGVPRKIIRPSLPLSGQGACARQIEIAEKIRPVAPSSCVARNKARYSVLPLVPS